MNDLNTMYCCMYVYTQEQHTQLLDQKEQVTTKYCESYLHAWSFGTALCIGLSRAIGVRYTIVFATDPSKRSKNNRLQKLQIILKSHESKYFVYHFHTFGFQIISVSNIQSIIVANTVRGQTNILIWTTVFKLRTYSQLLCI